MNQVILIGRLTKDPEIRYTASTQMAVANFSIAIDRKPNANGEKFTDYPRITVFGKAAENCERFTSKGKRIGIIGHLQTGSYEHNGEKRFTTDVIADRVEFIDWKEKNADSECYDAPEGFSVSDDDIPFA